MEKRFIFIPNQSLSKSAVDKHAYGKKVYPRHIKSSIEPQTNLVNREAK